MDRDKNTGTDTNADLIIDDEISTDELLHRSINNINTLIKVIEEQQREIQAIINTHKQINDDINSKVNALKKGNEEKHREILEIIDVTPRNNLNADDNYAKSCCNIS